MVNKEHTMQVIEGWNSGMIKWIPVLDDNLKLHEKELTELLKKGGGNRGGGNGEDDDTGMNDENRR